MDRSYRDAGRSSYGDYDDYRSYGRQGGSSYMEHEASSRDSYLGSSPGSSYRSGRSSYGGGGGYDRDVMESLLQQRALQQQLSLRESQLALANSLLQQQQQQQQFFSKRRMDPRAGDFRQDFKRPRLMDNRSRAGPNRLGGFQPRSRSTGGRDSMAGGRGSQGGGRRNLRTSRGRGRLSSDKPRGSRDSYDPEKPTEDEGGEGEGKFRCKPCGLDCEDEEGLKKHMSSSEHKDRVANAVSSDEGSADRKGKGHCNICDVQINVSFLHHQRLTFHKKRRIQVTKGCGWCDVTSFKNFSEVLEHRATEKHIKNQKLHEKHDPRRSDSRRDSRGSGRSKKEREPIKVELPPELTKFDPKVVVGQSCVISVTGWFCKLCNKFYNNENAAKETHCMTEPHFNNYKKFMYTKLRAKAEEERDAKEKAEEEEREKAAEDVKKEEASTEEPSSELPEGDQEMAEGEQEGAEENGVAEEGRAEEGGGVEGEEEGVEEEMEMENEGAEEAGEEILAEPEEEYVDDEGLAAAEEILHEPQEDSEDHAKAEGTSQEEEPQATEEAAIKAEPEEEDEEEEEEEMEEADKKRATRSPARGRGRGGNRARRGRRVAK